MYKLCFYVPDSHVEAVKQAVFAAGGGRVGAYDSCAWQVLGQGQFRPLTGSQPFLGSQGEHTDLGSHFFGLFCGLAAGNAARLPGFARLRASLSVQIVLSLAFFLIFAGAWALALA